jgi:peptide/nickel transport system permease protein
MRRYIVQRIGFTLLVIFGVSLITFFLARVVPGDPTAMWVGAKPTQEALDLARKELGLDRPLVEQYFSYMAGLLKGDLGVSLQTRQPVSHEVGRRYAATFELVTVSIVISLIIGIPLGVLSATKKDKPLDHGTRAFSISGVALPVFWLGMILQLTLHGGMGWFPLQGRIGSQVLIDNPIYRISGFYLLDATITGNWTALGSALKHIALPAITLSFASLAVVTRMSRSSMLEVLKEDYIQTSLAYGVAKPVVLYRYALKNALIPTITVVGLAYGLMLGGSVLVESIFDWPGLGRFIVSSITRNDFPAIMGSTMVFAVSYVTINLIVDLIYYWVDPRIKIPRRRA